MADITSMAGTGADVAAKGTVKEVAQGMATTWAAIGHTWNKQATGLHCNGLMKPRAWAHKVPTTDGLSYAQLRFLAIELVNGMKVRAPYAAVAILHTLDFLHSPELKEATLQPGYFPDGVPCTLYRDSEPVEAPLTMAEQDELNAITTEAYRATWGANYRQEID